MRDQASFSPQQAQLILKRAKLSDQRAKLSDQRAKLSDKRAKLSDKPECLVGDRAPASLTDPFVLTVVFVVHKKWSTKGHSPKPTPRKAKTPSVVTDGV